MVVPMVAGDSQNNRHITPHHVWAYLHADPGSELSAAEHEHILDCEACFRLFILCLKSKTFASVLKALGKGLDERWSA